MYINTGESINKGNKHIHHPQSPRAFAIPLSFPPLPTTTDLPSVTVGYLALSRVLYEQNQRVYTLF